MEETNKEPDFIPYRGIRFTKAEMLQRSREFFQFLSKRRTVRDFSDKAVPREVIEHIIMTAASAPSGANKQPWTFCAVSDPALKKQIREAAEKEEYANYHGRMNEEWIDDLSHLGTDWNKPFLETAPWLIIVFKQPYGLENGEKQQHYYVNESVGLAAGFLLAAIHNVGLVSLTHTPSPMNFLTELLERPANERPFLLIPVGYPADQAEVPNIERKTKKEVAVFYVTNEK